MSAAQDVLQGGDRHSILRGQLKQRSHFRQSSSVADGRQRWAAPKRPVSAVLDAGALPEQSAAVASLQGTVGNQAVQRLLSSSVVTEGRGRQALRKPLLTMAGPTRPGIHGDPTRPGGRAGPAAAASGSINTSFLQFKRTMVLNAATSRIRSGDLTGDAEKDLKAVAGGKRGTRYKRADEVDLSQYGHQRDSGGTIAWFRLNPPQNKEYLKSGNVLEGFAAPNSFDPKTPGGEDEGGVGWSAAKGLGDIANAADDPAVEWSRKLTTEKQDWEAANPGQDASTTSGAPQGASTELTRAEGGLWLTGGLFGMAVSLKDLVSDDKSAWDRVNAAINFVTSGAAAGGALAQIASTHMEEGSEGATQAAETGSWMLGYQEMFTTLSAGVKTVKAVVDLVKMAVDDKKHSSGEWVKATGELLVAGLETAKGVLRSIRQINETIGGSVTSQFAQVLPGIDIAIAAVKSIIQGFYLVVSAIAWHQMSTQKADLATEAGHSEEAIGEARKAYRSDSARIANLDNLIKEKDSKITAASKAKAATRDPKKIARLDEKIASLKQKKASYEASRNSAAIDSDITEQAQIQKGGPSRDETEEFDLAATLQVANKHRVERQAVHIGANLVQIAASIASLVSGPGAPAAIALKAAAMGIDTSLPFFRWVKQAGRNMAARNEAKGESGISNKIFRGDKSDAAKLADRKKQAVVMLKMIARLNPMMQQVQSGQPQARLQLKAHASRIELYLAASGVDKNALYGLNGKPGEQVLLLVKAIAQRELE